MPDTVNAVVSRERGINHRDRHFPHKTIIEDMPLGLFGDWNRLGIVERATDEQVADHRAAVQLAADAVAAAEAEKSARASAPKPKPATKSAKRPAAKKPVPAEAAAPASPLTAPVLSAATTEPEATDAPEASA